MRRGSDERARLPALVYGAVVKEGARSAADEVQQTGATG
jgi:hypothetical protein